MADEVHIADFIIGSRQEVFGRKGAFVSGEHLQILVGHVDGILSADTQWDTDELGAWWWEFDQGGTRHGQYG